MSRERMHLLSDSDLCGIFAQGNTVLFSRQSRLNMNIDKKRIITFLLNLVQKRPASRTMGDVARGLAEVHSIGIISGTKLLYGSADFSRAADLLRLNKIDPSTVPDAWKAGGRTDAGVLRGNEKWAGATASAGLVAVKCLPGRPLVVSKVSLLLPAKSHLVLPVDEVADDCQHNALVVVENLESFRRCGLWDTRYLSRCGANPLFIFRGEKDGTRADAVNALLDISELPVFAACDIDPAGLGIALTFPRLQGFVGPTTEELDRHLRINRDASSGRSDLYLKQHAQWARVLDASPHPEIRPLWEVVRRYGEGVVQEAFLERNTLEAEQDAPRITSI